MDSDNDSGSGGVGSVPIDIPDPAVKQSKAPKFKIIDQSKGKAKARPAGARHYTLNCERRLQEFKDEFRSLFEQQLASNYGSFEDHYKHVLQRVSVAQNDEALRLFNLKTGPEAGQRPNLKKGTVILSEQDVLNTPMVLLGENALREIYGEDKLDLQSLQNMAHNDTFIDDLFQASVKLQRESWQKSGGTKAKSSASKAPRYDMKSTKSFTSQASRIYQSNKQNKPKMAKKDVQNLSRVGSKMIQEAHQLQQNMTQQVFFPPMDARDEGRDAEQDDIELIEPHVQYKPEQDEDFEVAHAQLGAEDGLSHPLNSLTGDAQMMQPRPKTGYTEGAKEVRFAQNATMGTYTGTESTKEAGRMRLTHEAELGAYQRPGDAVVKSVTNADLQGRRGKGSGLQKDNIFDQQMASLGGATNASHASYAPTPSSSHFFAPQSRIFSSDGRRAFMMKKRRNIFAQNPGLPVGGTSASQGILQHPGGAKSVNKRRLLSTKLGRPNRPKQQSITIDREGRHSGERTQWQNLMSLDPHAGPAASTQFTGFRDQSSEGFGKLRGQSAKDMTRLLSAASQAQLSLKRPTFKRDTASVSTSLQQMPQYSTKQTPQGGFGGQTFSHRPTAPEKQGKSGIAAVDMYYDSLNFDDEVEHLRYSTEFQRLAAQIQHHWKAYRFPQCEQKYATKVLRDLVKVARFQEASEAVVDQLEDYLNYLKEFTRADDKLRNLMNLRQSTLQQLGQLTQSYGDLKAFELRGPQLMLTLRHQTVRIVAQLQQFRKLKNPNYVKYQLENDHLGQLANSEFYYEMESGCGNALDLISSGRCPTKTTSKAGRRQTRYVEVQTFLLDRLSVFLKDSKVLFLPKEHAQILEDISRCQQGARMQFNVQEIGIFEKIIDQLRPSGPEEERELEAIYRFVMENSQDSGAGGGDQLNLSSGAAFRYKDPGTQEWKLMANPMCFKKNGNGRASPRTGVISRDAKGRMIQRGPHRDVPPCRGQLDDSAAAQGIAGAERQTFVPLTNFQWEIPAVMVTTIPADVKARPEKFRYVAQQLRLQSEKIALIREQEQQRREEQLRSELAAERAHYEAMGVVDEAEPTLSPGQYEEHHFVGEDQVPPEEQDAQGAQPSSVINPAGRAGQAFSASSLPGQSYSKAGTGSRNAHHILSQDQVEGGQVSTGPLSHGFSQAQAVTSKTLLDNESSMGRSYALSPAGPGVQGPAFPLGPHLVDGQGLNDQIQVIDHEVLPQIPEVDGRPSAGEAESLRTATLPKGGFTPHIGRESTFNETTGHVDQAAASSKNLGSISGAGGHDLATIQSGKDQARTQSMAPGKNNNSNVPSYAEDGSKSPYLDTSAAKYADDQSAEVIARTAVDGASPAQLDETHESGINQFRQAGGDDTSLQVEPQYDKLTQAVGDDQAIGRQDVNSNSQSIPDTNLRAARGSHDGAAPAGIPRDLQGEPVSKTPTLQSQSNQNTAAYIAPRDGHTLESKDTVATKPIQQFDANIKEQNLADRSSQGQKSKSPLEETEARRSGQGQSSLDQLGHDSQGRASQGSGTQAPRPPLALGRSQTIPGSQIEVDHQSLKESLRSVKSGAGSSKQSASIRQTKEKRQSISSNAPSQVSMRRSSRGSNRYSKHQKDQDSRSRQSEADKVSGRTGKSAKSYKSLGSDKINKSSKQASQNGAAGMSPEQREQYQEDRRLKQTAEAFLDIMWSRVEVKMKDDKI